MNQGLDQDFEDIKKILETEPIKKYLDYKFDKPSYNKLLNLRPGSKLKLSSEERKKFRNKALDKFKELMIEAVKIMAKNEEKMPDLYNKPPIDVDYIIEKLRQAKREVEIELWT